MTISVADLQFRGPYSRIEMLDDRPGVWVVLDGRKLPPVAAGAADEVARAVRGHPARSCWARRCDRPSVAVFYTPLDARRRGVLGQLRSAYALPCLSDGVTLPVPTAAEAPLPEPGRGARGGAERQEADSRVA